MSTLTVLKEYLVGDVGYLLNDDNNGKTVMLSGAWGSGKTHFWLEDIKPQLFNKKQKNIYISLYGMESMSELKFEVLKEAYNLEVKEDLISKSASMLSTIAPSFGEKSLVDGFDKLNKKAKDKKAEEILKSGSIICLDDFERKSKDIDLNDLFGYISQLALKFNCKVVIILNSDVFEGEEANVFKTVKEKTVSKYLFFNPSVEELFDIIFKEYNSLKVYEDKIKSTFKEVGIINARIYNHVLDNIQEWIIPNKSLIGDGDIFRYFILANMNFILTHYMVKASLIQVAENPEELMANAITGKLNNNVKYVDSNNVSIVDNGLEYEKVDKYIKEESNQYNQNFIENLIQKIKDKEKSNTAKSGKYDNSEGLIEFINNNQSFVESLHFIYAFKLGSYGFSHNQAEVEIMNSINNFIETGIV